MDTDTLHPCAMRAPFGDGEHVFHLTFPLACEWEKTFDKSLHGALIFWLGSRSAPVMEAREIIRLGLIGGGMKPAEALRLVTIYVERYPIGDNLPLAFEIVEAMMYGNPAHQAARKAAAA